MGSFFCYLLSFEESEDQKLLREALSSLAMEFRDSYWRALDESGEFPQQYFDDLASNGWFKLNVPEEFGGTGLGLADTSIAIHEMSSDCGMSAGDIIMAICIFAIQTIKTFARQLLRERLLPELGDGKHIMSFALTEPTAGVNTLDIKTTAKKEGDGYVINGQKMWITLAHKASLMNVVARTTSKENAAKRTDGLTLFLVEKSNLKRGQIRTERIDDISMRALGSNQVYLEDVFVPRENILGEVDKGWEVLPTLLNAERISTASMSVGLGQLVLRKATEYAKNREVFGRPIGQNQAIQFPLARSKADLEAAWAVAQKLPGSLITVRIVQSLPTLLLTWESGPHSLPQTEQSRPLAVWVMQNQLTLKGTGEIRGLFRTGPVPEEMVLNFLGQRVLHLPRS